jgi:RNA polymerase sigma-70 factor (ECF subfamily)
MSDREKTDKLLLKQIALGDEASFECLFERYHARLFQYISIYIKSKQVAEEVVMDVFMKIWTGRDLITQVENFDSFLFRVAHNKAIDFLRSVFRDPNFKELMWDTMQLASSDAADTMVLKAEFEEKVRQAMSLLSEKRRKVFELSWNHALSHEQIAKRLGLSKNTVNNHIVEAKQFIRAYLSKNLDIPLVLAFCLCNDTVFSK